MKIKISICLLIILFLLQTTNAYSISDRAYVLRAPLLNSNDGKLSKRQEVILLVLKEGIPLIALGSLTHNTWSDFLVTTMAERKAFGGFAFSEQHPRDLLGTLLAKDEASISEIDSLSRYAGRPLSTLEEVLALLCSDDDALIFCIAREWNSMVDIILAKLERIIDSMDRYSLGEVQKRESLYFEILSAREELEKLSISEIIQIIGDLDPHHRKKLLSAQRREIRRLSESIVPLLRNWAESYGKSVRSIRSSMQFL